MMTEKGTFIVNGTERVVVSQLVRSPGVYYLPTIIDGATKEMDCVHDEAFGPVVTVETFTTEEEAIATASLPKEGAVFLGGYLGNLGRDAVLDVVGVADELAVGRRKESHAPPRIVD